VKEEDMKKPEATETTVAPVTTATPATPATPATEDAGNGPVETQLPVENNYEEAESKQCRFRRIRT
jgi:hypothetical protein